MARGQAIISVNGCKVQLNDVLLVLDANVNLIWPNSQQLVGHINPHTRHWEGHENDSEAFTTIMNDNVDDLPEQFDPNHKPKMRKFSNDFIHKLCGHPSQDKMRTIEKVYDINSKPHECQDCYAGKSTKARMGNSSNECAVLPLELVHVDLVMHFTMKTEFTCLLVMVDDMSSFKYVKPLRKKSDVLQVLKEWITCAEVQTGHKLKTLRSDNGTGWTSAAMITWQNDAGFHWQKTTTYTSKQNGKAE
ncbi:uncharacterized protein UBRO_20068 [Ustilago bromivora]|uniref:Integrase catalytic domain-containing protein n=1 Tax=Ustilago bromivora TaxID=307758 RepID=A0A1K0GCW8_9BASI|nr:uncharacterized protein UBRO_20068 [Ustilago bromivora]